jgi:hypothetical protein
MAKQIRPVVVGIAEPADIRTIADIHRALLLALQQNSSVKVAVPDGAGADLSVVQLIEAARRFAAAQGKTFALSAPAAPGLREILQRGGFLSAVSDCAFWLHQKKAH